jgi:formate C-acetyltransferase
MDYNLTVSDRIQRLKDKREWYNEGHLRINSERTRIITDYYRSHEAEYPILRRAGFLYEWCATREIFIEDDDILVSSTGPRMRSVNFNIESGCDWIPRNLYDSEEKFKEAWQTPGAVQISDEDKAILTDAFEYWKTRDIGSYIRGFMPEDIYQHAGNGVSGVHKFAFGMPQGHFVANFDKAVKVGFGAVRAECLTKIAEIERNVTHENARSHAFYRAMIKLCDGAILMSKRYADACREKAKSAPTDTRKAELLRMADSLDWIMDKPARNLWEGLQIIIFYQTIISADGQQHGQSIARVDNYVGELLENDVATGALTRDEAQELCDAFILRVGDLIMMYSYGVPDNDGIIELNRSGRSLFNTLGTDHTISGGIHITLGGLKPDGTGDYNLATELLLLSFRRLVVPDPSVCIRVNRHTPDVIWKIAIETSKLAGGIPQFDNDEIIIQSLVERGIPVEDARGYGIIGCVEPTIPGKEWPCCGSTGSFGGVTLIAALNLCIHGNVNPMTGEDGWLPCKKLYEYESFEELRAEYERQVKYYVDFEQKIFQFFEVAYSEFFPCVSASVMMDGCIESGKDVTWGGATYNAFGVMTNTIANTADSFMTIKKLCFDDKTVSLRELYDALCANWVGYESLRLKIVNDVPHYGNDDAEVDELARWCSDVYADNLMSHRGPRDCAMAAGSLTLTANVMIGKGTCATPDGRRTGEPMADAISPRQGAVDNGPVSYVKSAAKLSHHKFSNGDQLNIRFDPRSVDGDEGTYKLRELIQGYFDLGGLQLQFNVVATDELRKAQKDPLAYKDLIVRIAGFSTYFVHMSDEVQEDFINRMAQSL